MSDYTPTTDEMRAFYTAERLDGPHLDGFPPPTVEQAEAEFNAWLAAHDAEVRAEILETASRSMRTCGDHHPACLRCQDADDLWRQAQTLKEPEAATLVDERDPECVKAWPDCASFEFDPRCCRFPKSCSAGVVRIMPVKQEGAET